MKKILLFIFGIIQIAAQAQTPPYDKNWTSACDNCFVDGFSSEATLSGQNALWTIYNDFNHYGEPQVYTNRKNVNWQILPTYSALSGIHSGVLQLREQTEDYPCTSCYSDPQDWRCVCNGNIVSNSYPHLFEYTSGYIQSNGLTRPDNPLIDVDGYRYGYYEITCKLPFDKSTWPAFWLNNSSMADPTNCFYNEIDVFEMYGSRKTWVLPPPTAPTIETNCMHSCLDCAKISGGDYDCLTAPKGGPWPNTNYMEEYCPDYRLDFHTYGVEWNPDKIILYRDGNFLWFYDNRAFKITHPMHIIANLALEPTINGINNKPTCEVGNTLAPVNKPDGINRYNDMLIDEIKAERLMWDCNTVINQSNFDFTKYHYGVKKSITLSNSTVPANLSGSPTRETLRATDFILLQPGFEVAKGAELTLMPTPCSPDPDWDKNYNCQKDYIFNDNYAYNSGDDVSYQAADMIKAGEGYTYDVNSGSKVSFNAGKSIVLKPGFTARAGSSFHAKIVPCQ